MRRAISQGRSRSVRLLNYRRDGSPVWTWLSVVPLRGVGGVVTHFVGMHTFTPVEGDQDGAAEVGGPVYQAG